MEFTFQLDLDTTRPGGHHHGGSSAPPQITPARKKPRAVQSCIECHRSKRQCDRGRPCGRCIRRMTGDKCTYVQSIRQGEITPFRSRSLEPTSRAMTASPPYQLHEPLNPLLLYGLPIDKHPTLYVDDGSTVLVTFDREGDPGKLFCISYDQLGRQSDRMQDLLAREFARIEGETYNGRPVLRLEESTREVENLLIVILNGPWTLQHEDSLDVGFLLDVFRLSTRWDLPRPKRWSAERLLSKIPMTYDTLAQDGGFRVFSELDSPLEAIRIGEEAESPRLLSTVLYYICLIGGHDSADGQEVELQSSRHGNPCASSAILGRYAYNIIAGLRGIQDRCFQFWLKEVNSAQNSCDGNPLNGDQPCASWYLKSGQVALGSMQCLALDPLGWPGRFTLQGNDSLYCQGCYDRFTQSVALFSKTLFEDLPSLYQL